MSLILNILKKALWKLPFCYGKTKNEVFRLTHTSSDQTSADAIKVLELELAEERSKCLRLEQEYQRAKAEVNALTVAKRELDFGIRKVKELLEARERALNKTQAKVGHI